MKGIFVYHMLATTIALGSAIADKLETGLNEESVGDNVCETPACVDSASFIRKNMDENVEACQNFYQFACGQFVKEAVIPPDEDQNTTIQMVVNKIQDQLKLILSDKIKEDDQPALKNIKSYYQVRCMNKVDRPEEDVIKDFLKILNNQGGKNITHDLLQILENQGGCPILKNTSWDEAHFDFVESVIQSHKMGYSVDRFVYISVDKDPRNPYTKHILSIDFTPTNLLGNLKSANNLYHDNDFLKYVIDTLVKLGADRRQAEEEYNKTVDFEMQLAKAEDPDQSQRNKRMALHQLDPIYEGTSWTEYLNGILSPYAHLDGNDEVIIANTNILKSIPRLLAKTPKSVLANYLCLRTIDESIYHLRYDACREISNPYLFNPFSFVLSEPYVRRYFDEDVKTNATHLTENVRNSLQDLVKQANWTDNYSKSALLKNLQSLVAYIGYPDELGKNVDKINELFQNITFHPENFVATAVSYGNYKEKLDLTYLKQSQEPWLRHYSVPRIIPIYVYKDHSFDLPAGIWQGHFYNASRPNYMNYGAIGQWIGHEIAHDIHKHQELQSDENESKIAYEKRTKCFIEQYGNYTVEEVNMGINGHKTLEENIADNVGLKAAYFAYDKWEKENGEEPRLPGLQQYTPKQMFWISFANMWCGKFESDALGWSINIDDHSPYEFRVIGSVSNMHEFAKDFNCPSGSSMNPVNQCSVW